MNRVTSVYCLAGLVVLNVAACGTNGDSTQADSTNASSAGGSDAFGASTSHGSGNPATTSHGSGNPATTVAGSSNAASGSGGSPSIGSGDVGSGGSPPVVVRACPSGIGAVGVWEEVTPPQIQIVSSSLGMNAVAVDPLDPATVYASGGHNACCGAGSDGIYKSTDCGATWTKVNTGMNGSVLEQGWQWYKGIVINPKDSATMYVMSGYGAEGLWKSTNGGVDWTQLFTEATKIPATVGYNFTQDLSMDPADPNHLVVSFHADCSGEYAPMCMADSTDGGSTWRIFKGPPSLPGWQEGAGVLVLGKTSFLYSSFTGVFYTGDNGATWSKAAASGAFQLYKSPTGTMYLGGGNSVISSTDGQTWKVLPNSPGITAIIGDGKTLFASFTNNTTGKPIYTADEANPTTWTNVDTPTIRQGTSWFAYDSQHHILYSASMNGGLWRTVTQ